MINRVNFQLIKGFTIKPSLDEFMSKIFELSEARMFYCANSQPCETYEDPKLNEGLCKACAAIKKVENETREYMYICYPETKEK